MYHDNETMRKQNEAPKMADGGVSDYQRGSSILATDRLHSPSHAHTTTWLCLLQCQRQ